MRIIIPYVNVGYMVILWGTEYHLVCRLFDRLCTFFCTFLFKNAIHFDDIVRVGPAAGSASKTKIPNRKVPYVKVLIQKQQWMFSYDLLYGK